MHRRLLGLARQSRFALSAEILCGVLAGLCSLGQAYALSATINGVFIGQQTLADVSPWLRLLLGVITGRGMLLWAQEIAATEVAVRVKHDLRVRVFAHLLSLGPVFSRGERSGELTSTAVEGIEALDAYFGQFLPQLVVGVLVPSTILLIVFPLDPLTGAILLLTAPLIPFFMYMIGRTAELATSRQFATLGRLSAHLLDSIQGLTTLKIFGQSAAQAKNIADTADEFRTVTLKVLQTSFLSAFALELLATISTAVIAVEVGLRLLYGRLDFQNALFLLILAPEFYLPLRMLGARFHAGMAGTAAARRIFVILDTEAPAQESIPSETRWVRASDPTPSPGPRTCLAETPILELRDVSYTYPGREKPALEHIHLGVGRGQHIALVGASGAGKTTLTGLLLGFMRPTDGTIHIDGMPLERLSERERSALVSWVPQNPHLFHDSIAANIRLGNAAATDTDVIRAARLAHLDDYVASLPKGYGELVGEGGARLSSGEAQRLALARAFMMTNPVLILDEPTSSLDPEIEALLDESLKELGKERTVIAIAHRLSTVARADRIFVLHQGRILEEGTHDQLLAANGAYARIIEAGGAESRGMTSLQSEPETLGFRGDSSAWVPPAVALPNANLEPDDLSSSGREGRFAHLLGFLRGSWAWVALSVLLGSLTVGSSMALLGTSAWLISAAALHPSIASLELSIVGVRLFGIMRAGARYFERLVSHGVTFRILRNIRVWFYSRLEPLAPARLMDFGAGDLVARAMADVETLEHLFVRVLAPPATAVCVAAGASLFFALKGTPILAMLLAVIFFLAGFVVPLSAWHFSRRPGSRLIAVRAALFSQVVDGIQGLADILAFGQSRDRLRRLESTSAAHAEAHRQMARIRGLHSGLSSILANLSVWLTLGFVIPAVRAGEIDGAMLAPLALVFLASMEAISPLPLAGQMLPGVGAAAKRLYDVVNVPPAVVDSPSSPPTIPVETEANQSSSHTAAAPAIELRKVSFSYPGRSRPAVQEVSVRIEAGEMVGIVGPSGSGKSTIAALLLRFWEYGMGEIRLDGTPIRDLRPDQVRARLGYVSQHPYLFDTSVYENLRLARRGVRRQEIEQAARQAQIHGLIETLPNGYDTLIGEHGAQLSAGERQRLGIARLIIKNAPVAILDEPTANLDPVNEHEVLSVLAELLRSKTCLMITHRLVGMEHLDRILVMHHGRIVQQGTHASLIAEGGRYWKLWSLQNRWQVNAQGRLAAAA